jgi:hypothetical protein
MIEIILIFILIALIGFVFYLAYIWGFIGGKIRGDPCTKTKDCRDGECIDKLCRMTDLDVKEDCDELHLCKSTLRCNPTSKVCEDIPPPAKTNTPPSGNAATPPSAPATIDACECKTDTCGDPSNSFKSNWCYVKDPTACLLADPNMKTELTKSGNSQQYWRLCDPGVCDCIGGYTFGANCDNPDKSGFNWCYVKDPSECQKRRKDLTKSRDNTNYWKKC